MNTKTLEELKNNLQQVENDLKHWGEKFNECQDGAYRTIDITIDGVVYTESLRDVASEMIHDLYLSHYYVRKEIEKNFPEALDV